MSRTRHTIGLVFPDLIDFGAMCWGAFDAAAENGANAICFQGKPLRTPIGFSSQANLLYDMISAETPLDGLVMWTGWLGQFVGAAEEARFCERFAPLPIVSISQQIEGHPCVLGDNYQSMRDVVCHLVDTHRCRRLALVTGPPNHLESAQRYQAYLDLLAEYGIPFDPALVVSAQFTHESGIDAAHQLLDQRQVAFDAVITGDDFVALGVIEGLHARGVRVPEDVAVVGFDDTPYAPASIPPLTTVRQSAYNQGFQAVSLLLARLRGEAVPMQINLPMRLVVRQSCGCANPIVVRAMTSPQIAPEQHAGEARHREHPRLVSAITARVSQTSDQITPRCVATLVDAFTAELAGGAPGTFMQSLADILRTLIDTSADVFVCQDIISAMRQTILPLLETRHQIVLATNLWGQARVLIGETALRVRSQQQLKTELQTRLLREIGQEFMTTFDLSGLIKLVVQELPKIGITGCWLVRYDEPVKEVPEWAYLVAGFDGDAALHVSPGGDRFAAHQLAIDRLAQRPLPFQVVVEPLYFRESQLGFIIFEPGPRDGTIYEVLRGYLTTALYGALLFQHNLDLYRQAVHARAEAEKADQLKTQLLANVSHDLRAPLNVILGYTETALADPQQYGVALPAELISDLSHIRASAEYLVRIINDLLDLSRAEINELDLYPRMIDPRTLLQAVFENMVESLDTPPSVEWRLQMPPHLPLIQADQDRLRQILFNLLTNAHQHTEEGHIVLGVEAEPSHLHIWVQDTGSGIPADLQDRIFEPFVTGEGELERRKGIGLGLSITRQLVSLHRGVMSLESAPGNGSTFHVYLPLPTLSGETVQLKETGHAAMLLLSSGQHVPQAAVELAERQRWELVLVTSGRALNRLLTQDGPHYVAMAWNLTAAQPSDLALVRQIQAHPQLCRLPILLFEGTDQAADLGATPDAAHVTQVLVKPFSGEALMDAIARLLPGDRPGVVLAVDDDPQALDLYQRLVHNVLPQLATVLAHNGAEALRQLDDGMLPSLVILDLVMPGGPDGFEVLDRLRSVPATRHVPVLVLSGKMLTFADIHRLNQSDVLLHSKGVLAEDELEQVLQALVSDGIERDRQTSEPVKLALAYIHQHYMNAISRGDICAVLGISENYLSRLFREELGLTLVEFINRYRTAMARQLLRETGTPITIVAQQVGFDDPAYFSRVFARYVGVSPRQYRQTAGQR